MKTKTEPDMQRAFFRTLTIASITTLLTACAGMGASSAYGPRPVCPTAQQMEQPELLGRWSVQMDGEPGPITLQLRSLLTERGTLVIVGSEGGGRWLGGLERSVGAALLSPFVRQHLVMFVSSENAADLVALNDDIDRGALRPVVERAFPLEQAAAAVDHVAAGATRGKIIVLGAAS